MQQSVPDTRSRVQHDPQTCWLHVDDPWRCRQRACVRQRGAIARVRRLAGWAAVKGVTTLAEHLGVELHELTTAQTVQLAALGLSPEMGLQRARRILAEAARIVASAPRPPRTACPRPPRLVARRAGARRREHTIAARAGGGRGDPADADADPPAAPVVIRRLRPAGPLAAVEAHQLPPGSSWIGLLVDERDGVGIVDAGGALIWVAVEPEPELVAPPSGVAP